MEKRLRIVCEFPESAPFFRVSAMVRELAKSGRAVAPTIGLPDYDPEDPEQVALYNQLQQVGIAVQIPEQPIEEAQAEQEAEDAMREQWQTVIDESKPDASKTQVDTDQVDPPALAADAQEQQAQDAPTTEEQPE